MKYIITESQNNILWVSRRLPILRDEYIDTLAWYDKHPNYKICANTFEEFKDDFFYSLIDSLYTHFPNFEEFDNKNVFDIMENFFRDELLKYYNLKCGN
jgi:hypothetical protein